ncbi:MAG: thioredoxin family protein, partial [Isosphaeraceae bacterium]|nr:thioredoxin family protein [Isosphaeraceae bacterium]
MTIPALILTLAATIGAEGGQSGLKILDFHASWCGPCQQMRPRIEQLIRSGYPVRSIDIDHDEATAQRYGVTEVPTFIIVDAQGHPLARKKGLTPASELANLYRQALAKFDAAAKAERARASRSEEPPADDRDEESTAAAMVG